MRRGPSAQPSGNFFLELDHISVQPLPMLLSKLRTAQCSKQPPRLQLEFKKSQKSFNFGQITAHFIYNSLEKKKSWILKLAPHMPSWIAGHLRAPLCLISAPTIWCCVSWSLCSVYWRKVYKVLDFLLPHLRELGQSQQSLTEHIFQE